MRPMIAGLHGVDKSAVRALVLSQVDSLLELDPSTEFDAEKAVWACVLEIGRILLVAVLAQMCFQSTVRELAGRGWTLADVRLRLDANYHAVVNTTLGKIVVPLFAYRFRNEAGCSSTRCPGRAVFPLYPRCHSSRLLLRWETTLGSRLPFREVQRMLELLTHGAVSLHDTTVAAHCAQVAVVVGREHMYFAPDKMRQTLRERAVCDSETGLPIVHFSCDGHAERLLDADTWSRNWRSLNGIRIWCIDRETGRSIHLGGEFIVGDCHAVSKAFENLNDLGILPFNGDYGDGVHAQLVFVADGAEWFDAHVRSKFPSAIAVLDAYHVLEKVGQLFTELWGSGSKRAKKAYALLCRWVSGRKPPRTQAPKPRKAKRAHKPRPRRKKRRFPRVDHDATHELGLEPHHGGGLIAAVVALLGNATGDRVDTVLSYLIKRVDRLCYASYWERGFHISSAAMESFNRIAQQRIKLPGAAWTPAMAQAILNLRMMVVSGNDESFWMDEEVMQRLAQLWKGEAS